MEGPLVEGELERAATWARSYSPSCGLRYFTKSNELNTNVMEDAVIRPLKLADIEQAAEVISQAFVDDPLCTFMLPFKRTRIITLRKFFRAYGAVNIHNQRGFGVGVPLKGEHTGRSQPNRIFP
jgi:hypothetical protein